MIFLKSGFFRIILVITVIFQTGRLNASKLLPKLGVKAEHEIAEILKYQVPWSAYWFGFWMNEKVWLPGTYLVEVENRSLKCAYAPSGGQASFVRVTTCLTGLGAAYDFIYEPKIDQWVPERWFSVSFQRNDCANGDMKNSFSFVPVSYYEFVGSMRTNKEREIIKLETILNERVEYRDRAQFICNKNKNAEYVLLVGGFVDRLPVTFYLESATGYLGNIFFDDFSDDNVPAALQMPVDASSTGPSQADDQYFGGRGTAEYLVNRLKREGFRFKWNSATKKFLFESGLAIKEK